MKEATETQRPWLNDDGTTKRPWYPRRKYSLTSVQSVGTNAYIAESVRRVEDAELIVRAVNAHDDLLEACKAELAKFTRVLNAYDPGDGVRKIIQREHGPLIEQLEAAIAKADGKETA